jgi:diguanylate cyclase (GGDEF)-like protein/PAS domain S-box-containing protein
MMSGSADVSGGPDPSLSLAGPAPAFDTRLCEREPIDTPGAVQPHGALLAVLADGFLVSHASTNLEAILGCPVESVLGRPLEHAIGAAAYLTLLNTGLKRRGVNAAGQVHILSAPDGGSLYLHAHRSGRHFCIDIEPIRFEPPHRLPIIMAQAVLKTFAYAASPVELCELAVNGLKTITGYDRVMAYRFGDDGHGEVIAEAADAYLEPFLGLHYPASDIPPQARRLYMRQRVGAIADAAYTPVLLRADPALDDGVPLDLTQSALRSVSPVHRAYMRNMNTAASLTVGLVHGDALWGMLVCHHTSPRVAGPELRAAVGTIGQVVSLLLASLGEAELFAQRLLRHEILREVVAGMSADVPLPQALATAQTGLLQLTGASGAVLRLSGEQALLGHTPPPAAAASALEKLHAQAGGKVLAIDDLGLRFPELSACTSEGSGALFLPLDAGTRDAMVWFRPEVSRNVTWGGNPSAHGHVDAASGAISPRTSFAAWKETVRGHSAPWTAVDLSLAEAWRAAVQAEIAQRTRAALLESEARLGLLAEHSGVVVVLSDIDATRRYVSPAAERVLGWRPEEMVGRSAHEFIHPDDRQLVVDANAALLVGGQSSSTYRFRRPDGSWLWVDGHARLRTGDAADGGAPKDYVVVLRDATERKAEEQKLLDALDRMEQMAATDGLTGLANRRRLETVADREWRRCARDKLPLSVLLLDADRFKLYNDRYGHLAGDECLRSIATQLAGIAQRPGDVAARYGGEEFVLLLANTDGHGALNVATRLGGLIQELQMPHEGNAGIGVVTVSIGVATAWPADRQRGLEGLTDLLAAADAALYRAKSEGRNRVVVEESGASQSLAQKQVTPAAVPAEALQAEAPPSTEPAGAHEALMQFLYRAPIGLVQTTLDGTVEMINPMAASLLIPLSTHGDLDNLFAVLHRVAPELRELAAAHPSHGGAVFESMRIALPVGAELQAAKQVLAIGLQKLDAARLMLTVSDVTLEVQRDLADVSLRLEAAASTDSIAQMPNRAAVRGLIQRAIDRERTEAGQQFAVLFINCDRFKQVNDSLGAAAGDEVLGLMADRLRSALRQPGRGSGTTRNESMAGRLGGDEFVVLVEDLQSPEEVHAVVQRLLDVLGKPYAVRMQQLHLSVSIGVVLPAPGTADADAVLQDASIAMAEAKRAGGARHVVFEPSMRLRAARRGEL